MKLLSLLFSILACPLFAAAAPPQYRVEMQIFIEGKLIASPRIVSFEGQPAQITEATENSPNKLTLKVSASGPQDQKKKNLILVDYDLGYIGNARTIRTSQQILVKNNTPTSITIGNDAKKDVQIKLTATQL